MKRIAAVLLAFMLALPLSLAAAFAAEPYSLDNFVPVRDDECRFTDISGWSAPWIVRAFEYGFVVGLTDEIFAPEDYVKTAESVALCVKLYSTYSGIGFDYADYKRDGDTAWYDPYVRYALEQGFVDIGELGVIDESPCTRAMTAHLWSKIIKDKDLKPINTVNSLPDVAPGAPYYAEIVKLYEAGILKGNDSNGTFAPDEGITRAQYITMFLKLIDVSARSSGHVYG
ncbi:hypothetical protein FACS18949_10250 [Clostridia bacterium]|nr:hypothetical protein FACS18949_10250 [Clostridia bacterium]